MFLFPILARHVGRNIRKNAQGITLLLSLFRVILFLALSASRRRREKVPLPWLQGRGGTTVSSRRIRHSHVRRGGRVFLAHRRMRRPSRSSTWRGHAAISGSRRIAVVGSWRRSPVATTPGRIVGPVVVRSTVWRRRRASIGWWGTAIVSSRTTRGPWRWSSMVAIVRRAAIVLVRMTPVAFTAASRGSARSRRNC